MTQCTINRHRKTDNTIAGAMLITRRKTSTARHSNRLQLCCTSAKSKCCKKYTVKCM